MSPLISIIIDVVMVGLLAATIAYAIILNRQIIKLRESRGEMAELIHGLNEAMARAETGVRTLKKAAGDSGEDLQRSVNKAQTLRDELEFMIEAADALANRLGTASERSDGRVRPAPPARGPASAGPVKPPLMARPALRALPPDEDDHHPPPARLDAQPRRSVARTVERSPERLGEPPPVESRGPITRDGESLSRAERELLQAIENAGRGLGG